MAIPWRHTLIYKDYSVFFTNKFLIIINTKKKGFHSVSLHISCHITMIMMILSWAYNVSNNNESYITNTYKYYKNLWTPIFFWFISLYIPQRQRSAIMTIIKPLIFILIDELISIIPWLLLILTALTSTISLKQEHRRKCWRKKLIELINQAELNLLMLEARL